MGVLGGLAARGEHHDDVWAILGVEHPRVRRGTSDDLYPDALPCDRRAPRGPGCVVWRGREHAASTTEERLRPHVDFVGSSARWGVAKPRPAFFARLVEEAGVRA